MKDIPRIMQKHVGDDLYRVEEIGAHKMEPEFVDHDYAETGKDHFDKPEKDIDYYQVFGHGRHVAPCSS